MTNNYFKVSIRITPAKALAIGLPGQQFLLPAVVDPNAEPRRGRKPARFYTWVFFFDSTSAESAQVAYWRAAEVFEYLHERKGVLPFPPEMSVFGRHLGTVTANRIGHFFPDRDLN